MARVPIAYLLNRLGVVLLTAFTVSSLVFIGVHQLPGNAFLGDRKIDPAAIAAAMHHYHLDVPLAEQYRLFLVGLFHGNLGESLVNQGVEVTPLLLREALVSLEVGVIAVAFTFGIGIPLGVIAAVRHGTWVDYVASSFAVVGFSMPNFVIASFLVVVFAVWLYGATGGQIYYSLGWQGTFGTPLQLPVPAFALGFPYAGIVARLTRAGLLDVLHEDYVRTARAKGLRERSVILHHGLRNALIPLVSVMGPLALGLISGSVVIENVFGIPGLGQEFVTSILDRDYNIVIGLFTIYALLIGLVNLLVDVIYVVLDPRVRY